MTSLIIPDDHGAYHHPDEYDFLRDVKMKYKPDVFIHVGDEYDGHHHSSHPKNPECYGPEQEAELTAEHFAMLAKLFPKLKLCHSNHGRERLLKAAARSNIAAKFLKAWGDAFDAPKGWKWANEWKVDNFTVFHGDGYLGKGAIEAAVVDFGGNVVFGHLHSQGAIEYHRRRGWQHWGMCTGCLIDRNSPALGYSSHHRKKLVLGCGLVVDGVPHFVPMT